uniref:NADH-ubiquinone oxidoreductase chain 2 n=1 Tax=Phintella cavaleriei TaxID=1112466 RepID=A0A8A9WFH3_9ARAC|nr:NADH dehydrogenase subunit 2 [Phintella cavaleriei]QTT58085.1 NADH dehydrogenase subunit 2 [Phintella cavaleriei]
MYMVSFIVTMSSDDWFLVWVGLEINMLSFLVLMFRRCSLKIIESCLKYFFIQSLGSALFISMFYLNYYEMGYMWLIMLSYKIGAGPFFYWFPSLCSGVNWLICYFLMIFQKFLPLLLISMFVCWFMWLMAWMSLLMGIFGSFNQNNIKQLLGYSSIHHLGWIYMIGMNNGEIFWLLYLMLYSVVLLSVVILLIKGEVINFIKMYSSEYKLLFILSMLSMAGLPPLLGFYLKWMALLIIIEFSKLYLMMMVLVSVVMLYIYMRILYDIFMGGSMKNSWFSWKLSKYNIFVDIYSIMGIMMGMFVGIYMLM